MAITNSDLNNLLEAIGLGAIWFSLGGIDKALWALGLPVYLVLFFFLATLGSLSLSCEGTRPRLWFSFAVLAAVLGTLSSIQGLLIWPSGLLVILWAEPRLRSSRRRAGAWIASAMVTAGLYFLDFHAVLTPRAGTKPLSYSFAHLGEVGRYALVMLGSLVSVATQDMWSGVNLDLGLRMIVGALMLAISIVVCVMQSRRAHAAPAAWLPVVLIAFGMLWDLVIAFGRCSLGLITAPQSHYQTPQILISSGIVIALIPMVERAWAERVTQRVAVAMGAGVLAMLFIGLVVLSDVVGYSNAVSSRKIEVQSAQLLANLDHIPRDQQSCYVNIVLLHRLETKAQAHQFLSTYIGAARADHLSMFSDQELAALRGRGPTWPPTCR